MKVEEIKAGMKLNAYRLFCQHCQALQKTMGWEGKPCWVTQYNEPTAVCASAIDAVDGWFNLLHSQGLVIKGEDEEILRGIYIPTFEPLIKEE